MYTEQHTTNEINVDALEAAVEEQTEEERRRWKNKQRNKRKRRRALVKAKFDEYRKADSNKVSQKVIQNKIKEAKDARKTYLKERQK